MQPVLPIIKSCTWVAGGKQCTQPRLPHSLYCETHRH